MLTVAAATAIAATVAIGPFSSGESAKPETGEEQRVWGQAKEFDEAIRKSAIVYRDEPVTAYVQSVMDRLFPEFDGRIRLQVVQAPQLNAFALPDGNIYVNLGLLARFQNEAQLAWMRRHVLGIQPEK